MKSPIILLSLLSSTPSAVTGFVPPVPQQQQNYLRGASAVSLVSSSDNSESLSPENQRRQFLKDVFGFGLAAPILGTGPLIAQAVEEGSLTDVYFGVGCFWHIQHEFVEAERKLLKRDDGDLTSMTGYAGGLKADSKGRVCYHNLSNVADYGKLGHGEVVGMRIPENMIGNFAKEYFSFYSPVTGERVDPGDKGPEYRSLLGLPGGSNHASYPAVEAAAKEIGYTLVNGKGNDPDTFGKKQVFVMDTVTFPFYQAEVYHQYHDDFQSKAYGKKYNNLANIAFEDGRLKTTGCPDRV